MEKVIPEHLKTIYAACTKNPYSPPIITDLIEELGEARATVLTLLAEIEQLKARK